jgi:uncharacterized RDD family membrane protein YckC/phage FluMu protein Com
VAIEFNCPHCSKLLTTTESRALALAKCPSCNELITVPAASPATPMMSPEFAATAAWPIAPASATGAGSTSGFPPIAETVDGSVSASAFIELPPPPAASASGASLNPRTFETTYVPFPAPHVCPRCDHPVAIGAAYCAACGTPLVPAAYPLRYAGFVRRTLAALIDLVIVCLGAGIISFLFQGGLNWQPVFFVWFFYNAALESSREQATVGKRLLGMFVCGADGRRLTFARAGIRTLAKLASLAICGMGFVIPLLTPKRQGLHDLMTDAVVVLS